MIADVAPCAAPAECDTQSGLEFGKAQWLLDGVVGPGIGSADTVHDSQTLGLAEDFDIP